jgi:hypothetical protein
LYGSKTVQPSYFGVSLEWIPIEFRLRVASATCCGVNLATGGFGFLSGGEGRALEGWFGGLGLGGWVWGAGFGGLGLEGWVWGAGFWGAGFGGWVWRAGFWRVGFWRVGFWGAGVWRAGFSFARLEGGAVWTRGSTWLSCARRGVDVGRDFAEFGEDVAEGGGFSGAGAEREVGFAIEGVELFGDG